MDIQIKSILPLSRVFTIMMSVATFSQSALAHCPTFTKDVLICSREFSFFDDEVPWKQTSLSFEQVLGKNSSTLNWSFGSEVGTWNLDGAIHQRPRFLDLEISQTQCLSDTKIESIEVFKSRGTFDVRREMTMTQMGSSVRLTLVKDLIIGGNSTNSDEEKWNCIKK